MKREHDPHHVTVDLYEVGQFVRCEVVAREDLEDYQAALPPGWKAEIREDER